MLRFRLGEPRPVGEYEGLIDVDFRNPGISNITFEVTGTIIPLIEAKPSPAFFVSTGLIGANTFIHGRVHTFPEDLDFGTIDAARVRTNDALRKTLTQVLMVYQDAGTNSEVTAKTDLPFLHVLEEPSKAGEQVEIELAIGAR